MQKRLHASNHPGVNGMHTHVYVQHMHTDHTTPGRSRHPSLSCGSSDKGMSAWGVEGSGSPFPFSAGTYSACHQAPEHRHPHGTRSDAPQQKDGSPRAVSCPPKAALTGPSGPIWNKSHRPMSSHGTCLSSAVSLQACERRLLGGPADVPQRAMELDDIAGPGRLMQAINVLRRADISHGWSP